jgi:hypothetical protein
LKSYRKWFPVPTLGDATLQIFFISKFKEIQILFFFLCISQNQFQENTKNDGPEINIVLQLAAIMMH